MIEFIQVPHGTIRVDTDDYGEITKLYVQVIDSYAYQREFTISLRDDGKWDSHAYWHPGRRYQCDVLYGVGRRFIGYFLSLTRDYPSLLFKEEHPRHDGFVHLHEQLLAGNRPTVKMLQ